MARLEDFDLGLHAGILDHFSHLAQMGRRVHEHRLAEIHGAAVERADVRTQFQNMPQTNFRGGERRFLVAHHRVVVAGNKPRAFTGGQVDQDVTIGVAIRSTTSRK